MTATHRHKTTGAEVSARKIEEPVTVHLADGAHEFAAGDYEVTSADSRVTMHRAEDFEEEYEAFSAYKQHEQAASSGATTQNSPSTEAEKQEVASDPEPPEAA